MKYSIIYFEEGMGWYDWTTANESDRAHSEIITFDTKNEAHDYVEENALQDIEYQVREIDKP